MADQGALVAVFAGFARTATGRFEVEDMLRDLAEAAGRVLTVDGAGVMVARDGCCRFVHANNHRVDTLERLQDVLQQGPCGDAISSRRTVIVEYLTRTQLWPQFTRRALRLGLRSVLSLPLLARGQVWGSLDLVRFALGPYASDDLAAASTLADVATSYVVMAVDRDAAIALQQKMTHRAMHDELTGLPNRALLFDRLSHAIVSAHRRGSPLGLLFIDLDDFKAINDTLGHVAGDALLVEVAERLTGVLRADDTLARLSGDEFVIVCENLSADGEDGAAAAIGALIGRVQESLSEPARLGETLCAITASIGSAAAAPDHHSAEDLLRAADHDMYRVKRTRARRRAEPPGSSPRVGRKPATAAGRASGSEPAASA